MEGLATVSVTIREKPKGSTVLDLIPCFGDLYGVVVMIGRRVPIK